MLVLNILVSERYKAVNTTQLLLYVCIVIQNERLQTVGTIEHTNLGIRSAVQLSVTKSAPEKYVLAEETQKGETATRCKYISIHKRIMRS